MAMRWGKYRLCRGASAGQEFPRRMLQVKKLWAIICVIGFTAFWTFGFIAVAGVLGERQTEAMTYVFCLLGLGAGLIGWFRVMRYAPQMHGRRAAARARLEEEYQRSLDKDAPREEERATVV